MIYWMLPLSVTLNDPPLSIQVHAIIWHIISWKWYKLGQQLLWNITRNSYAIYQMMPFPVTEWPLTGISRSQYYSTSTRKWYKTITSHNYLATPSVCLSFACCRSPSARPAHLTHIWALESGLCVITVGVFGGGNIDNFCVSIITNCYPNYWNEKIILFRPKIMSELLERLNYWEDLHS